ncbi:hypothetical protein QC281_39040 [Streptomyces sp. DH17]|nr:hypothetical protein [Streptomyces sp. DH17]
MMDTTLRATSEKLWSPGGGLQIAAGDDLAVLPDGQAVGGVLEPAVEGCQPLIARQHQELDLRLPLGLFGIEPARAVLDGIAAVGGQGLAGPQRDAG